MVNNAAFKKYKPLSSYIVWKQVWSSQLYHDFQTVTVTVDNRKKTIKFSTVLVPKWVAKKKQERLDHCQFVTLLTIIISS